MAVREIPAAFLFTCDGCGTEESMKSKSRPTYWADLIIQQDAYDFQSCAVADGTVRRLLCGNCKTRIVAALNAALNPNSEKNEADYGR